MLHIYSIQTFIDLSKDYPCDLMYYMLDISKLLTPNEHLQEELVITQTYNRLNHQIL